MGIMGGMERRALLANTPPPHDDYWYLDRIAPATHANFPVSPETASRVTAVLACVEVLAVTLASLPLHLYRRTRNGGKERATDHWLYPLVNRRPNAWQTRFEFIEYLVRQLFLRGGGYADTQGIRQHGMIPVHPDRVTVEQLASHRLRYQITPTGGGAKYPRSQDDMLHIRDTSEDAITGLSRTYLAREAIGVAGAGEARAGRFLRNDISGRVVYSTPNKLDDIKRAEIQENYQKNKAGWENQSRLAISDNGGKLELLGSLADSGFLIDPRKFQIAEICRCFGRVPPFMIGHEDRTTWGTNVEQIKQGFVAFCAQPVGNRLEQAMQRDLLDEDEQEELFLAFTYEELLRGDLLATVQALAVERQNGALNPNEWRAIRNRNPREDPGGEKYLETPVGGAPNPGDGPRRRGVPVAVPDDDEEAHAIPAPLMADAAERIAGGEIEQVGKRAAKASEDGLRFAAWVRDYFAERKAYYAKVLGPWVQSFGVDAWAVEESACRLEVTAVLALGVDGVPVGWAAQRRGEVAEILEQTFTAASLRRAA